MYFIDTNIFMYAAGSRHPHKIPSVNLLHRIASRRIDACINVEVLQEILHRYRSINRWEDGKSVYLLTRKIISLIYPIDFFMLEKCFNILENNEGVMARDALHAAFCEVHNIESIYSYDRDFDIFSSINRIEPD